MPQTRRGRGVRTDPQVESRILELDELGHSAPQIRRTLLEQGWGDLVVAERTIQAIISKARPRDRSLPWEWAGADPDDAALVLPIVADVVERTHGRVRALTVAEAEAAARLRRVVPDLPLWDAYRLARRLVVALQEERPGGCVCGHVRREHTANGARCLWSKELQSCGCPGFAKGGEERLLVLRRTRSTMLGAIESYLAFAPWRDGGQRYGDAWARGWISQRIELVSGGDRAYVRPKAAGLNEPNQSRDHLEEEPMP